MAKIIIPKEQLPGVSEELTNKLRYRIINKNRNLYSEWSVIGEIKRDREEVNFLENETSYSASATIANRIEATWYTSNINQSFDIYLRYKTEEYYSAGPLTWYKYEPLQYLGSKETNYLSITRMPLSNVTSLYDLTSYGVQIMVKLPEYPKVESSSINVTEFERNSNYLEYTLSRDVNFSAGDYVNINISNNYDLLSAQDNSDFAGIKRVYSVGDSGNNTFKVYSPGGNIALRVPPDSTSNVTKINGKVQFVTNDIIFT
jgi:hypothetical protein